MHSDTKLPAGYQEIYAVNLQEEKKAASQTNLLARNLAVPI